MSAFVSWRRIEEATMEACSCGGMGPLDPGVCPACVIYHRLKGHAVTLELSTPPATEEDMAT